MPKRSDSSSSSPSALLLSLNLEGVGAICSSMGAPMGPQGMQNTGAPVAAAPESMADDTVDLRRPLLLGLCRSPETAFVVDTD